MEFYKIPFLIINKPQVINIRGGFKFYINNLIDVWTLKEIILDRQYEKLFRVDGGEVIDIGAGLGDFSILASKKAEKVLAFECDKKRFMLMNKNLQANHISKVSGFMEKVSSLDELFKKYKVRNCDFLKIDCEGAEYKIFQSASRNTLSKIKKIAFEIHIFKKNDYEKYLELKRKLKRNNFLLKEIANPVHTNLCYLFAQRSAFFEN
nr:FkbM family methyltransferase [uncultured Microgenomates bacterium Rifle_16ft_4_minimus_37633]